MISTSLTQILAKEFNAQKFSLTRFTKNMIGKISQPLWANQNRTNSQRQQSFGSNYRAYSTRNAKDPCSYSLMETTTCMFRDDISWIALTKFLINHFKKAEKVQILNPACSDGSEAYTLIMMIKELDNKNSQKYLPIKACDIDEEILRAANSGLIKTTKNDRIKIQTNIKDFTKYLKKTNENLNILNDTLCEKDSALNNKTLKVTDELKNSVEFKRNDLFNMLRGHKDNANTLLMCRNVLGHLTDREVRRFAELAHKKLDNKSVIVIGDFDRKHTDIDYYLREYNFKNVLRNVYVKDEKSLQFGDILQDYLNDYRVQARTSSF